MHFSIAAFGWGPYPIAATEGRATERGHRGPRYRGVAEPDAFLKRDIWMGPLPHRGHRGPRYGTVATEGRATASP